MTERGKHEKSLGKGGTIRHRKVFLDKIQDITKLAIRRLGRHENYTYIRFNVWKTREGFKVFLENVITEAVMYFAATRQSKIMTVMNVVNALKRQGRMSYGFEYCSR